MSKSKDLPPPSDDGLPPVPETIEDKQKPEIGGPKGLEPTRFGDWEQKGRCTDF